METGNFVVSLDFELMWGVRDKKSIAQYGQNIKGVQRVIPQLIKLFDYYKVKATFATVGFLFFENKDELLAGLPARKPNYSLSSLSPYSGYFDQIGENAEVDCFHYAAHLIREIQKSSQHEIGTHTFSHYYCLEDGQMPDDFREDLLSASSVAAKAGIEVTSLVFPRNQFNDEYLQICADTGIICYRGNEQSWLYKPRVAGEETLLQRALRLADSYINISGHNCYSDEYMIKQYPVNIPASRFLRPFNKMLKPLEFIRLHRIKSGMTYAAKNNLTYHLWWHPHNFGVNQHENFLFLENVLKHFERLNKKYSYQSRTMSSLANELLKNEKNEISN